MAIKMKVNCNILEKGAELCIDGKRLMLEFPAEVWKDYPENLKRIFANNYSFLKPLHLPLLLGGIRKIDFDTAAPIFRNSIYSSILNSIPFCADVDGISTAENLKKFINLELAFNGSEIEFPAYDKKLDERAVIAMSFGKESLLSFALAEELGLNPSPVVSLDNDCLRENRYKIKNAKRFSKEFRKKHWVIKNGSAVIHSYRYWGIPKTEWGYGHLITEYCLNMLPFMNFLNAKYAIIGNEKSCDDSYINREGYKSYPIYDQSSEWVIELSRMLKQLTANQADVISLVEPIYELAVIKILHKRYPKIGKYQMSCFPDENEHGKSHYWCQHCSKCARIFIFMAANNLEPSKIGFNANMLNREYMNFFPLFGANKEGTIGYDASRCGRDEQLYSFYLAHKNGARGYLIDEFKKHYLGEAREREEEFHKRFFGIHDSKTIPKKFIKPLHSIYREELLK